MQTPISDAATTEAGNFPDIRRIAVIGGGGLMGHGIVAACLTGHPDAEIRLVSRREESLAHGMALLESGPFGPSGLVKKGKLTEQSLKEALARVRPTLDLAAAVRDADLIFETVPEVVGAKHAVLARAEAAAHESAIIATNTSSIMIAEIGRALARPERLIGTHWFYPANVMPLVEVARSTQTAQGVVDTTAAFLRQLRKKPVVVNDAPGFFTTRFINLFIAEAMHTVEQGICGIAEVDEMVKTGLGWPMGVFELLDKTASFDSWYHAQAYLHEELGEGRAITGIAQRVFGEGYRGDPALKPGSRGGWYDYFKATPKGDRS
jgi:3-hydroxybutyryl-CoA dehydrogenase